MDSINQYSRLCYQRFIIPIWLMGTLTLSLMYLDVRFNIAFPEQDIKCLPYTVFIIDTFDKKVKREGLFAFKNRGWMEKFEDDQWTVIKLAAGMPGDQIVVSKEKTLVGGDEYMGLEEHVINKLEASYSDFEREEIVPVGSYFALGTLERTYDSRYWGFVEEDQLVGRAYAIF
jgi:signal peptidase I